MKLQYQREQSGARQWPNRRTCHSVRLTHEVSGSHLEETLLRMLIPMVWGFYMLNKFLKILNTYYSTNELSTRVFLVLLTERQRLLKTLFSLILEALEGY